ncbi:uncharacterized protein LOC117001276 [Catharus ustulatus]|uniref:uncharacterized protein LOC117001276 n=1 Tax=Catharus ustulatus TaxID=91951 RepID=UPI00140AB978|nr:uncharacterized protein LOC117001276 [Catharus ustulatus]
MEGVSQILIQLARDGKLSVKAKDIQACLEWLLKDGAITYPRDIFGPEGWGACTQALAEHAMATKSAKHLKVWGTILQLLKRGMEEKETMWAARKALGLDCYGRLPFTEEQETQVEKGELEIEPKQEGSDSEILTAQEEKGEEKQVQEEIMARVCLTCGIMKPMSEGSCLGCIKKAYPVTGKRLNPPQYPWDDLREAERKARSTQPAPSPAPLPSAPPQFVDPEEWLPGLAMKAPEDPLEMAAEIASPEAGRGADGQRWREREVLRPEKGNQWRAPDKHPDIAEEVEELSEQLAAAWGTEEGGDAAAVGSRKPGREPGRLGGRLGGTSRAGKAQVNDHQVQMNLQQLQQLVNEITAEVEKQKRLLRTRSPVPPSQTEPSGIKFTDWRLIADECILGGLTLRPIATAYPVKAVAGGGVEWVALEPKAVQHLAATIEAKGLGHPLTLTLLDSIHAGGLLPWDLRNLGKTVLKPTAFLM